jgi:uncharacterized protein YrrD
MMLTEGNTMSLINENTAIAEVMVRGSDVIGKPVITYDTGKEIEKVKDILFDHISNQIIALTVAKGGWRRNARVLSWGGVHAIGKDAVMATSADAIMDADDLMGAKRILDHDDAVIDKQLMTTDGRELGKVAGVYFNSTSGKVIGYEVSGGIFADMMNGRSFMPTSDVERFGEEAVLVTPDTAHALEEQVGGVRRSVQAVQDEWQNIQTRFKSTLDGAQKRAGDAGSNLSDINLRERLGDASSQAQQTLGETTEQMRSRLKQALVERTLGQAEGHTAQQSVLSDDNKLIVTAGQTVTEHVIQDAREHNKEVELMESVGLDVGKIVRINSRELRDTLQDYAGSWVKGGKSVMGNLRISAMQAADNVKSRIQKSEQ